MAGKRELAGRIAIITKQMADRVRQCVPCAKPEYEYGDVEERSLHAICTLRVIDSNKVLTVKVSLSHQKAAACLRLNDALVIGNVNEKHVDDIRLSDMLWGEACAPLLDKLHDDTWGAFLNQIAGELAHPHYQLPQVIREVA